MAQEATNIFGHLIEGDIEMNETVSRVEEARTIETMISCEKGRRAKCVEQGKDFRTIFHPKPADFTADLPKVKLTGTQPFAFWGANIFIQDIHATRRRSVFSISASLASLTASAIASWLIRPS